MQRPRRSHSIECWTDEKPRHGLSAAARQARYRLLASAADNLGADVIVTGHTMDDQIETVAMRAGRSSEGALGLAGMAPATLYAGRLWILRPFLRTRRTAIRIYLTDLGQPWIDDPSNEDVRYERVRIRQAAPAIAPDAIRQAADHRAALSSAAATWLDAAATCLPGPVVKIDLDDAPTSAPETRDHALATLVAILGGRSHRPAAESLARLGSALESGGDFRLNAVRHSRLAQGKTPLSAAREARFFAAVGAGPSIGNLGRTLRHRKPQRTGRDHRAGPAAVIAEDLPGAVWSALSGNAPQVIAAEAFSGSSADAVTITPRLSLFAEFLPVSTNPGRRDRSADRHGTDALCPHLRLIDGKRSAKVRLPWQGCGAILC